MGKGFDKFLNMIRLNDDYEDEYDDYDDYDDEFDDDLDDIPAPVVKKKSFKKESKEIIHSKNHQRHDNQENTHILNQPIGFLHATGPRYL